MQATSPAGSSLSLPMPTRGRSCRRTAAATEEEVVDYAVQMWRDLKGDAPAARAFRERPDAAAAGSRPDAGGRAALGRFQHFQDHQLPRGHQLRGVQGRLHGGLGPGLQRLHDLPAECRDGIGADGGRDEGSRAGAGRRPRRAGRRGDLPVRTAGPSAVAGGGNLQGQMAGQRTRDLHHDQRHRAERAPAALRGVHQFQEHGAFRLDRRPDADDLGGVPARAGMCPSWWRS